MVCGGAQVTYVLEHQSSKRLLATMPPDGPSRGCAVCGTAQLRLAINTHTATLGRLVSQARSTNSDCCVQAKLGLPCEAPYSRGWSCVLPSNPCPQGGAAAPDAVLVLQCSSCGCHQIVPCFLAPLQGVSSTFLAHFLLMRNDRQPQMAAQHLQKVRALPCAGAEEAARDERADHHGGRVSV